MGSLHGFYLTVLRKSFYIHWSAGRSPRVHEVNPGRDPSRLPPCSQARSGRVRRRLAVKFYGQDRPMVVHLPVLHVYSSGGRNRLPRLKPDRLKNGSKRPSSEFSCFFGFSLGFWGWILTWHPKLGLYRA